MYFYIQGKKLTVHYLQQTNYILYLKINNTKLLFYKSIIDGMFASQIVPKQNGSKKNTYGT
jgi:hypothetical protein